MMKVFLLDKLIPLGFLGITFIFMLIFLVILNVPAMTIWTVAFIFIMLIITWLMTTYIVSKRKLENIKWIVTQLEQPYLAGEILPTPNSYLEHQYFDILRIISKDAIERVEQADRNAQAYKEFVEQWIHELKTPMTAMGLILANEGDTRKLRKELKRLDNLTDQILHFARLQSIEKDKQFEQIALATILNQSVKNQMDILIAARMQVVIDGDTTIYTDQKALQFIMNQLLINSAKYCPESKVLMTIRDNVLIYEDNGIGILKHELPRIFEKGYTGTNGRKLGTSTGMGLYIVANMCKELNIQLNVESKVGQFTRFILTFPQI
ncbi:sensor histidine kinase [Lysinibacillus sp. NPDC097287]|uniref:sensor histidine kinase n=1 Tax=Lysinibacillus sp. NPDC097287 TaxID=3364144 RepID=UPI0037F717C0